MARARSWWSVLDTSDLQDRLGAMDVLSGSGLAVPGATVTRSLGHYGAVATVGSALERAYVRYGVRVDTIADGADLLDSNWNQFDWMYLTTYLLKNEPDGSGYVASSTAREPAASWDTTVQRTLQSGQTVWFVWRTINLGMEFPAVQFARTLVLDPPA